LIVPATCLENVPRRPDDSEPCCELSERELSERDADEDEDEDEDDDPREDSEDSPKISTRALSPRLLSLPLLRDDDEPDFEADPDPDFEPDPDPEEEEETREPEDREAEELLSSLLSELLRLLLSLVEDEAPLGFNKPTPSSTECLMVSCAACNVAWAESR